MKRLKEGDYVYVFSGFYEGNSGYIRKYNETNNTYFISDSDGICEISIGWIKRNRLKKARKLGFFEGLFKGFKTCEVV